MYIYEKNPDTKVLNSFVKDLHKAVLIPSLSTFHWRSDKRNRFFEWNHIQTKYNRLLGWVNVWKVVGVSSWTVSFSYNSSNGLWDWSGTATTQQYWSYSSGFIIQLQNAPQCHLKCIAIFQLVAENKFLLCLLTTLPPTIPLFSDNYSRNFIQILNTQLCATVPCRPIWKSLCNTKVWVMMKIWRLLLAKTKFFKHHSMTSWERTTDVK